MTAESGGKPWLRLVTFGRLAVEPSDGLVPGGPRPHRLALLAILASRGERGQPRDRVLAILWRDSSAGRGRHALSQTLYALRQDLGRDVLQAGDVLRLDPRQVSSDTEDFRVALEGRDWSRAAALYAGPFAAGFTLANAPGFEEWLDLERRRFARDGHRALVAAAQEAEAGGDLHRALPHWRRLVAAEPLSTRYALGYIQALSSLGERTEALEHALGHAALVRRELDADPDPELRAVIADLSPRPSRSVPLPINAAPHAPPATPPLRHPAAPPASRRRFPAGLGAMMLTSLVLAAVIWRLTVGRDPASRHVAAMDLVTRSPVAHRLYEEGLATWFQSDWATASRLFRAALAEDSTFAQAGFYAWRTAEPAAKDSLEPILLRLADRAPDRERLLARTFLAAIHSDPPALALADSLDRRFPSDPDALIASGLARLHRYGFTPGIVQQFERAITLDSMTGPAPLQGARVAEALRGLHDAYVAADSSGAAERTLRRWMGLQPENATPAFHLSGLLERLGRVNDADLEYARNEELSLVKTNLVQAGVWKGINRGDPELLLQTCRLGLSSVPDVAQFTDFRWRCLLAYRHLGRLRDALELARPRRLAVGHGRSGGVSVGAEGLNLVILEWMMGRPHVAARGFLEVARNQKSGSIFPGENARREVWWLTLAATAFIAAGDTRPAAALVDSIRDVGARSNFGRDPVLHHFVRGLILSIENRHADAMAAFLRANYSWTLGYTRINYELARCALAMGRPREAIYPLQAALRGGLEGPQLYVTQTELHELLAQAFEAAGMPDSARSHYGYVARMWAGADPEFAGRHRRATAWLRRHGGA